MVVVGFLCLGLLFACAGGPVRQASEFSGPHVSGIVDVDRVGPLLATVGDDRVVHVWTWPELEGVRSIPLRHLGTAVAFSPDGSQLAVADRSSVVGIWDTTTWTRLARLKHSGSAMAWKGSRLAVAMPDEDDVAIYDTSTGHTFVGLLEGHTAPVVDVAFSGDGAYLATASADKTARVWEVATGQERQLYAGHKAGVVSVAFSPDGAVLATGSQDKTARVWDVGSGEPMRQLSGHTDWVISVAFPSRPGVVASIDAAGRHRLWSTTDGASLGKVDVEDARFEDALFADDALVLVGADLYVENVDVVLDSVLADPRPLEPLDDRCAKLVACGKALMRDVEGDRADRGLQIVKMAREMNIDSPTICLNTLVTLPNALGEAPPVECSP